MGVTPAMRIVVIGGSFGGVNAAYELRRRLGAKAEITVIARDPSFVFLPSLPWVIMGWRDPRRLEVPLGPTLARRGIGFVHGEVTRLDTAAGKVHTAHGEWGYDYLVIASGPELDYAAVPGLGPDAGYTHSTFTTEEAVKTRDALSPLLASDGGSIVVGAAPGASCGGPGYEILMMVDTVLRRAKKRHRFRLVFATPEPFVGHFGVGGLGASRRMFEDAFADRDIEAITNAAIVEGRPDRLVLRDGTELPFDLSLVIPSFLGVPFVRQVEGLGNAKGFITVHSDLSTTAAQNVYAVGVAIAIAPPAPTEVPVGVPKTGHMTELMATAAAKNIAADIAGDAKVDGMSLPSTCIADAGDTAFYLSADPFLPPRNKVVHKQGRWARYLKLAFERYYLARIRHGLPSLHFGW
jgi:sulfide:quinone oxidoreductase